MKPGRLYALEGSTGKLLWSATVGQAVTEIRLAELDGDPGTREVVAGGKNGGVWAYSQTGARLFAASVGGQGDRDRRAGRGRIGPQHRGDWR